MSKNTNLSFLADFLTADTVNTRVGINNVSPQATLDVAGTGKFSGVLTLGSTVSNGTYTYTLPSATGTLALTSDLSGYVTLGTSQTITAIKYFSNTIVANQDIQLAQVGTALSTFIKNINGTGLTSIGSNGLGFNNANNLYFSGSNKGGGVFAFSNSGTQIYTLQDASGTLAFTSQIPANPVGGTGTTNYLPKFTASTTIGNSQIIDNGTQVGIGLTPNASYGTLQIKSPSSVYSIDLVGRTVGLNSENQITFWNSTQTSGLAYLYNSGSNLYIGTGANQPFTLSSGGNFIFGSTTDAGFKLDVNGSGVFRNTLSLQSSGVNAVQLSWTGSNTGLVNLFHSGSLTTQILASGNSYFNGGNVGIGTASPLNKLSVVASNSSGYYNRTEAIAVFHGSLPTVLIANDGNAADQYAELRLGNNQATYYPYSAYVRAVQGGGIDQYRLEFGTSASVPATTKMTIATSGNVGIGTTIPGTKLETLSLHTSDVIPTSGLGGSTTNAFITQSYGLLIGTTYTVGTAWLQSKYRDSSGTLPMSLQPLGGNLGIGTASPTTYSLSGTHTEIFGGSTYSFLHVNTTTVKSFLASNESALLTALFTFSNHPLTLGTNNTERMRITSGGNVLIGTTTDVGLKLNVSGAIRASYYSFLASVGGGEWQIGSDSTAGSGLYFYQTTSGYSLILSAAGLATFGSGIITNGNIELTNGVNRSVIIGSATNYNYRLRTDGDDFAINEAGAVDRLRYSYLNARWNITGGLAVSGALSKGSGSFRIDHPLPEKKDTHQLVHSFIEGPQADNIYRGKVKLINGYAEVNIDKVSGMTEGTFVLLNGNVQCFTSNESGWTAIKGRIDSNILIIESEDFNCADTVSWMVVGERHDQHMIDTDWTDKNGKVIVEPLKNK